MRESAVVRWVVGTATNPCTTLYIMVSRWFSRRCSRVAQPSRYMYMETPNIYVYSNTHASSASKVWCDVREANVKHLQTRRRHALTRSMCRWHQSHQCSRLQPRRSTVAARSFAEISPYTSTATARQFSKRQMSDYRIGVNRKSTKSDALMPRKIEF